MTTAYRKSKSASKKLKGRAGKKENGNPKLGVPPAAAIQADDTEILSEEQNSPEEPTSLTPQMVELFCDGIESVHRNWLVAQGVPEDYMPSWKDINEQNPRLPYDEDAPKTIEELFASLKLAGAPSKAKRAPRRRVRRRA
jgi:hypothetical protein